MKRPGSDKISSKGFIYKWSGMNNGAHLKGVAIGISNRLQLSFIERIMILKLKHNLGFMSLVAVCAPTEMCGADEKDLDQCPCWDTLIVLSDNESWL